MIDHLRSAPGIAGRTALVTGASRGIGAAIARALGAAGATVVVTGRNEKALNVVAASIRETGGRALVITADLSKEDEVLRLREDAERAHGEISLVAACAGGGGQPKLIIEEQLDRWRASIDTNLVTAFLTLKAFLPPMLASHRGAIVTMASAAGRQPAGASAPYSAAKAGLIALTRQAALEAASSSVRVNAVAPYTIVTDRLEQAAGDRLEQMRKSFPLQTLGTPEDVANATLFLLSDAAQWITGTTLDIAGGKIIL